MHLSINIEALIARKTGFASHQNAVPLVRELSLCNDSDSAFQDLVLTLSTDPSFIEPRSWHLDRLNAGDRISVTDRDVTLNAGYLAGLTESLMADVVLRLSQGETLLAEQRLPVELLARTEWGGLSAMPELLAAFCMPNDPAVDRVLKGASEVLRRAGKKDAIDGYEGRSRSRTWELASAIWSAVCNFKLSYALPPASFEQQGQKIRAPSVVLENGLATCLDSALLFAAALEQAGLNALLIMTRGHAFCGVWLQPQEFSQLLTDEAAAVRKRLDLQEMLVFETTLATQSPRPGFSQAVAAAERLLDDEQFIMAIDLHRARMQKIRPLAVLAAPGDPAAGDDAPALLDSLEEAPALPAFDVDISEASDGPAGKLMLWQRKLLDLTTRNRLLHLPDSAKGVRLVCADPAALEDLLASGRRIRVVPVPDLQAGGRDLELYQQQNHESLLDEVAAQALARGEILANLEKSKLEATLIELYRKARSDLDEGGANTLFLAIGFLKWKKTAEDPKVYSAPLILLPVKLERKSALSGVTLGLLDEEPRFNLTLLELLRHDFELQIPGLEGELPGDENGIDVLGIWNTVRRAVRDVAGFEVSTEVVLGTFSFAKYLMWKDLAANTTQLLQSPLVRHLLEREAGSEAAFARTGEFPRPEQLDATVSAAHLFTPLPADSSQLSAVVASATQHSFVLDGPPGTGKSQTIANMIAHNLALGRRVLFVAEKRAALDVVYRRLAEQGLGEFCLELHSSKASKVEVLKQLESAWDVRDALTAEQWQQEADRLQTLRSRLNELVEVLHRRRPNGLSLHQAIGRVIRDHHPGTPRLQWPAGTEHAAAEYAQLLDLARRLGLNGAAGRDLLARFGYLAQTQWSNAWQARLADTARQVPHALDAMGAASQRLLALVNLPLPIVEPAEQRQLSALVALLCEGHGLDLSFAFAADAGTRITAAQRASERVAHYQSLQQTLSVSYADEACRQVAVDALQREWQEAEGKFWFFATLAKNKVTRQLMASGGASGQPDTFADLATLKRLQADCVALDELASDLQSIPGWHGVRSDSARMQHAIQLAQRLRSLLSAVASTPEQLIALRASVSRLLVDANDMLAPGGQIDSARVQLEQAQAHFESAARQFDALSAAPAEAPSIDVVRATCLAVQQQAEQLKAWCDWCRVREQAREAGLGPLAQAVEAGSLEADTTEQAFTTAYAHWFATHGIDSEPLLRTFVVAEHMSDIAAFNRLDDELAKLTVRYIRARLCGAIPAKNDIGKQGGFAILKHELQKSRRHKPVRQLTIEMGDALNRLAPCMLMSPLSIAQFLPPDQPPFDLVIFDEASQIAPWDAIGSIARGRQVVIAGDPRQMPPTNFFNRGASADDDDTAEDMESILDECLGAGVPSHSLSWHYRSRHESLIAFSNHRYYDSQLITFPAAETRASAVEWRRVEGVYAKGKGRHNQVEAQAIVDETVKRLTDPAFIAAGHSIGIITLNTDQQKLVSDLLDRARQLHPQIEPFFQDSQAEPVVVKNLETVQGDERDVIMLGIGYGPTEPGAPVMSMNFGPLNKEGGWRRLNVAITRSRREMLVFSSFDPAMIDLNRTNARAVRDLKHFIEFAQRGPRALAEAVQGSVGGYDSPFEEAVAQGLRRLGWQVVPQIGVSRFRIDLGIVHPDRPGDYLAGVECDGATYHSAATARDRDKVRGAILRGLGWQLLRLWSTDWWVDKEGALQRLDAALNDLLHASRAK